jgi:hypothetical protein
MAYSTRAQEKRLAELKKEVTKRGADRYASRLDNVSQLPADLLSPTVTTLVGREVIQHIIVFPPQIQRGWHYVPRQALLFTTNGIIHLLASIWPEHEPQITCMDRCGLLYMKATLLLLYGHLEIVAQGQHSPVRLGMEFNTVSWSSISTSLRQFLGASKTAFSVPADQIAYSPNARQAFEQLPFKFFNGVQLYGLLPGEELEELVFQQRTWMRRLYFFRRPKTADTLLMLTSNYMVVIQEDLSVRQGWIITYIPRNDITEIQSQDSGLWQYLCIQLKREGQTAECKLLLARQAVDAWHTQWTAHGGLWQELPAV